MGERERHVGWVERSEPHHNAAESYMVGLARKGAVPTLDPPYTG